MGDLRTSLENAMKQPSLVNGIVGNGFKQQIRALFTELVDEYRKRGFPAASLSRGIFSTEIGLNIRSGSDFNLSDNVDPNIYIARIQAKIDHIRGGGTPDNFRLRSSPMFIVKRKSSDAMTDADIAKMFVERLINQDVLKAIAGLKPKTADDDRRVKCAKAILDAFPEIDI